VEKRKRTSDYCVCCDQTDPIPKNPEPARRSIASLHICSVPISNKEGASSYCKSIFDRWQVEVAHKGTEAGFD